MSSFLGSLRSTGITVPPGINILDWTDGAEFSEAAPPATSQAENTGEGSSQAVGVRGSVLGAASA